MPTPNFNLPLITGASPISIVNDMNSLANAADSAMGTLASQGDISAIQTLVTNANKVATEAQTEAVKASGAAEAASKAATTAQSAATTANTTANSALSEAREATSRVKTLEGIVNLHAATVHPDNPWKDTIERAHECRVSDDGKHCEFYGFLGTRTTKQYNYAANADVQGAKRTIPGTSKNTGVPLYYMGYAPTNTLTIPSAALYWTVATNSEAFCQNNSWVTNLYVGTDGILYIDANGIGEKSITYGSASATFSIN